MIFELYDCTTTAAAAISFACVAPCLSESQVAHRGYDLVGGRASISKQPAKGFAQTVRLALQIDNAGSLMASRIQPLMRGRRLSGHRRPSLWLRTVRYWAQHRHHLGEFRCDLRHCILRSDSQTASRGEHGADIAESFERRPIRDGDELVTR